MHYQQKTIGILLQHALYTRSFQSSKKLMICPIYYFNNAHLPGFNYIYVTCVLITYNCIHKLLQLTDKIKNTAPCIGHKRKNAIIEKHDAQSQQPEQNIKMFNVGYFLQQQKSVTSINPLAVHDSIYRQLFNYIYAIVHK